RIPLRPGKQPGAIFSGHQIPAVGVDDKVRRLKDSIELTEVHRKLLRSAGFIRFDGLFKLQCGGVYKKILSRGSQGDDEQNRDEGGQRQDQNTEAPQENLCVNRSHSATSAPPANMYPTP